MTSASGVNNPSQSHYLEGIEFRSVTVMAHKGKQAPRHPRETKGSGYRATEPRGGARGSATGCC